MGLRNTRQVEKYIREDLAELHANRQRFEQHNAQLEQQIDANSKQIAQLDQLIEKWQSCVTPTKPKRM